MDGISGVIVAIFLISIIGSVTKLPDNPVPTQKPTYKPVISQPVTTTPTHPKLGDSEYNFMGGYTDSLHNEIYTFIKKKAKRVKVSSANMMAENIIRYSKKYDVNPKVLTALICAESRFNSQAVSSSGAQGLGQLLPSTARSLGVTNSFNIEQNIMGTSRYFRSMLDRFKAYAPRVNYALAGYKEGPNAVLRRGSYNSSSQRYIDIIMKYYGSI